MKVFVTGSTGVLGRPVVRMLAASGTEVIALSRSPANRAAIAAAGASPVEADMFDPADLARHLDGCSAILHLATHIPRTAEMKSPQAWAENDRIRSEGTAALVRAARQAGTVDTIVYPGVSLMYGDGGDTWLSAPTARIEAPSFLKSTLEAERHVTGFAEPGGRRRGVALRFAGFYGPDSRDSQELLAMAHKGVVMPLAPAGAYRSQIWIEDAASAILAALQGAESGIHDVAEDDPFTQDQAIAALAASVGRRNLRRLPRLMLRFALPSEQREMLARSQRVSAARFRDMTGWRPEVANQTDGWNRIVAAADGALAA